VGNWERRGQNDDTEDVMNGNCTNSNNGDKNMTEAQIKHVEISPMNLTDLTSDAAIEAALQALNRARLGVRGPIPRQAIEKAIRAAYAVAEKESIQSERKEDAIIETARAFVDQYLFTGVDDHECDYAINMLVEAVRAAPEKLAQEQPTNAGSDVKAESEVLDSSCARYRMGAEKGKPAMTLIILFWLISVGGAFLIWSRATFGYMDFTGLFFGPVGLLWFVLTWLVYFAFFKQAI
jgi:hypothetical protein